MREVLPPGQGCPPSTTRVPPTTPMAPCTGCTPPYLRAFLVLGCWLVRTVRRSGRLRRQLLGCGLAESWISVSIARISSRRVVIARSACAVRVGSGRPVGGAATGLGVDICMQLHCNGCRMRRPRVRRRGGACAAVWPCSSHLLASCERY